MTDDFEETSSEQSCYNRKTKRPRLLSEQCETCVLRPGNPMHLRAGRLRDMCNEAIKDGSQGIICHDTLTYGPFPDYGPAVCRGFYDTMGYRNNFIRIMDRLGGFEIVPPP